MADGVYENEVIPPLGNEPEPTGGEPPEEPQPAGAEPAAEPAEPTGDEPPADPETEKEKGVQKRIDELTRKRREAEREAEYWKNQATQGQQQPAPPTAQPEFVPPGFPAKPTVEQFETYEDFVEALTDWKTDLKLTRKDVEAAQRQAAERSQTVASQHTARVETAKATYADYSEAIDNLSGIMMPQPVIDSIIESDLSADIAYYLGKHTAEAKRIQGLPVTAQLREIGKIEARLEKKPAEPAPPVKRVTQAPEPIKPVGGKEKATVSPDDMSDDEWLKHEQQRLAKMGRLY